MKFTINSGELLNHLRNISKVLVAKSALPILDCVHVRLTGETLTLTASDGELSMQVTTEVTTAASDGQICIYGAQLLAALKEIGNMPVTFSVNANGVGVVLDYGMGRFELVGESSDAYPLPQNPPNTDMANISSAALLTGINFTVGSVANDELRPQMNGVYFDDTPTGIVMVASDGHRMATYAREEMREGGVSFILPPKASKILKGLLEQTKEETAVSIALQNSSFAITGIGQYILQGRMLEGKYPNYRSVIPTTYTESVTFNRLDMISALRRCGVCASKLSGQIKLQLLADNKMCISSQDVDFSTSAEETISAEHNGAGFAIGVNLTILSEQLNTFKTEEIRMTYSTPDKAILLTPVPEDEHERYLHLLMPMMLNA